MAVKKISNFKAVADVMDVLITYKDEFLSVNTIRKELHEKGIFLYENRIRRILIDLEELGSVEVDEIPNSKGASAKYYGFTKHIGE